MDAMKVRRWAGIRVMRRVSFQSMFCYDKTHHELGELVSWSALYLYDCRMYNRRALEVSYRLYRAWHIVIASGGARQ